MAMPVSDANAVNMLLHWAMGHELSGPHGCKVTDENATEAARRLAGKAHKPLMAGLTPERVRLSVTAVLRERLIQARGGAWGALTQADLTAIGGVLNLLDRIERAAMSAAGTENGNG